MKLAFTYDLGPQGRSREFHYLRGGRYASIYAKTGDELTPEEHSAALQELQTLPDFEITSPTKP